MKIALIVTTLGRLPPLERLLRGAVPQLDDGDRLVIVAQRHEHEVRRLVEQTAPGDERVVVTTSEPGASRGRNAGVARLARGDDPMLLFPNDTTWFPDGVLDRLRTLDGSLEIGALTIIDEHGPKFELPPAATPLDRSTVWSVIEMGLVVRRSRFDAVGGFDDTIGTGAPSPWQAGEATDLLLRLRDAGLTEDFTWLSSDCFLGGVADSRGLAPRERRRKLRGYGRGLGRLVVRHAYPRAWIAAFVVGGILFGVRHGSQYSALDGAWVFLGRLEGVLGRVVGSTPPAVSR